MEGFILVISIGIVFVAGLMVFIRDDGRSAWDVMWKGKGESEGLGSRTTRRRAIWMEVEYPEKLSRWHLLVRTFLAGLYVGIPHGIILYFYGILVILATSVAFFAILFTGRYPRGLFDFVVGYYRWNARVDAYLGYMVDEYPPFSADEPHAADLEVEYPERLSRTWCFLKLFFGWLYVGIPHGIALFFYAIAVFIVGFFSWWFILLEERFPRDEFRFVEGFVRWNTRVAIYLSLLRDEYPPFSGQP